ncbi:MAG: type VI secretion system tip protein VgrG [Proteobacteria bacterium]|nr:MAG: type VI secretion system tip protein VgrG [Pseudomonadota bacterium]
MALKQNNQFLKIATPLGDNVLVAQSLEGRESVSEPFHFVVRALSESDSIDENSIVGKSVTIVLENVNGETRYFNGIVARFVVGQKTGQRYREYRLEIMPWLGMLKYRADCRIFQEMTPVDIIESVFCELGFSDYQFKLQNSYAVRRYCVQYRETDFNFVCRLMEEEGIFYFFRHENGKHTLVLCDYARGYEKVPKSSIDVSAGSLTDFRISTWQRHFRFCSGRVAHTDYNFTTPGTSLMTNQQTVLSIPNSSPFEVYDYPGDYGDSATGDFYARNRMEAIEADFTEIEATSDYHLMAAGYVFKAGYNQNEADAKKSFVVKTVVHQASEGSYHSDNEVFEYRNSFICVPADVVLRPHQVTPRPFIRGTQTAVVVGPAGDEIFTDEYGRVKVQFFWDRHGTRGDSSSCWIRVAQFWAGKKWGAQFLPRIGHEVLVSFLEGDPDRPLIIGSVYNADTMPTYDLPANKAHSGIKSRSTKGGSTENFNEIRFEDDKGKELLYLHAEKDEEEMIENNQKVTVGVNQKITVGVNQDIHVGNDSTENIGNDLAQTVGHDKTLKTEENHLEVIGKHAAILQGGNRILFVGENYSRNVLKNVAFTVGGAVANVVAKDVAEKVGGSHSESVGKNYALEADKIQLEAKESIVLKCGKAKITMKKDGTIIVAGGKINVKGSKDVIIKGSKVLQN